MSKYIMLILFPFILTAEFQLYPPSLKSNPKKVIAYWIHCHEDYLKKNEDKFSNIEKNINNIPFDYGYCIGFMDAMTMIDECLNHQ